MTLLYSSLVLGAISAYGAAAWSQWQQRSLHGLFCFLGLMLHTFWLYISIEQASGQDLSLLNMTSQVAWGALLLGLWFSRQHHHSGLLIVLYTLSAISILASYLFPMHHILNTKIYPIELMHILLSIVTMTITLFMALLGALLWIEHYLLRHKSWAILRVFPPLEEQERLWFLCVGISFISLSILILFSLVIMPWDLGKFLVSVLAWFFLALVLWGHYRHGWRGPKCIGLSMLGMLVAYHGYFLCHHISLF